MARSRLDTARARADTRDWAKARRERTRHLIELGGLVAKAGLVELAGDDRATVLGALLEAAARLRGADDGEGEEEDPAHLRARWRRLGLRAFHDDSHAASTAAGVAGQEEEGTAGERPA